MRSMIVGISVAAVLAASAVTAATAQGAESSGPTLRTETYVVNSERPNLTWVGKGQIELPKCPPKICTNQEKDYCSLNQLQPIESTKYFKEAGDVYDVMPRSFLREQAVECEETTITAIGPTELGGEVLPAVASLTYRGVGTIKSLLPQIGLTISFEEGPTCTFQTSKIKLTYSVGEVGKPIPFQPSINNLALKLYKEHANPTCPKSAVLRESFSVYGEGEQLVFIEP
jgi:hypothetical protein